MREFRLCLIICGLFLFPLSCAEDLEMNEVEQTASEAIIMHYVAPPPTGNYLDSMQMAFVNALEVSGEGNIDMIYNGTLEFREDYSFIAVVHYSKNGSKRIIYVNGLLIREYTWNGYLLIALHEWFHLNRAPSHYTNDQGHAFMVVDPEYRTWIKRMFDCSDEEARWLAYVGTENTMVYNNLSAEEKAAVQIAYERFRIKRKK